MSFFAKKNNLTYEEATYILAGVGGQSTIYNSSEDGRIYLVPFVESYGNNVTIKAFSVENILTEK